MQAFATKTELEHEFISRSVSLDGADPLAAKLSVATKIKYVPHIYRGGWVIPGFGFSIDRIGVYVTLATAGNPSLVA